MRDPVYNVGREDLLSFCSWSFELTSNVYHEFSTVIYILYRRQKGIRKHRFRTYRFVIFCFCLGLKLVLCSLLQYDKYLHALENRNLNLEWKSIGRCKFSNTRYKFRNQFNYYSTLSVYNVYSVWYVKFILESGHWWFLVNFSIPLCLETKKLSFHLLFCINTFRCFL